MGQNKTFLSVGFEYGGFWLREKGSSVLCIATQLQINECHSWQWLGQQESQGGFAFSQESSLNPKIDALTQKRDPRSESGLGDPSQMSPTNWVLVLAGDRDLFERVPENPSGAPPSSRLRGRRAAPHDRSRAPRGAPEGEGQAEPEGASAGDSNSRLTIRPPHNDCSKQCPNPQVPSQNQLLDGGPWISGVGNQRWKSFASSSRVEV